MEAIRRWIPVLWLVLILLLLAAAIFTADFVNTQFCRAKGAEAPQTEVVYDNKDRSTNPPTESSLPAAYNP